MANLQKTLFVAVTCALLCGCEQTTSISGTATYNGAPIEFGSIMFSPVDGKGRNFGASIKEGSFVVEEAAPGKVKVLVTGQREIYHATSSADAYSTGGDRRSPVEQEADYIPIDAEGNGQEVEIKPGDQTLEFAITGPPAPK